MALHDTLLSGDQPFIAHTYGVYGAKSGPRALLVHID